MLSHRSVPALLAVSAGLLAAAPVAATAQVRVPQDLRSPDAKDAADRAIHQDLRSPDARDVVATPAPAPQLHPQVVRVHAGGFDVGDAAIGAGASVGLLLLAGAASTTVARRRAGQVR